MNPALGAALATVVGALMGERLGAGDGHVTLGTAGVAVLAAIALPRSAARPAARPALVAVACALLASSCMQRALDGVERHGLVMHRSLTVSGTLVGDPDPQRFATSALLRVERVDGEALDDRVVRVRTSGDAAMLLAPLAAGDRVTVIGRIEPLHGYDQRYRWQHAVGTLRARDVIALADPSSALDRVANIARTIVFRGMRGLPATERALLAGFLLGDTRALPDDVDDAFRAAGMTHLLAVSGANLAFVIAIARPVLTRWGRTGQFAGGLALVALIGAMTRWEPSVLRAATMAGLSMWATYLGRPQLALRVLALATATLVVIDPFLVHSVGFVLSVGASLGIVAFGTFIHRRLVGPEWFREGIASTAAAQIVTAPVLLTVFGAVPLIALPANLAAGVVAGPLTTWGLGASVVGGCVPWAAPLLQIPTLWLTRSVLAIADGASRVPLAIDARLAWQLVAVGAAAGVMIVHRRRRVGRVAAVATEESSGAGAAGTNTTRR